MPNSSSPKISHDWAWLWRGTQLQRASAMPEEPTSVAAFNLEREVGNLRFAVRLMWVIITGAAAFFSISALNAVSTVARILVDMLGGTVHLPQSTQWLVWWTELGGGFSAMTFLGLVAGVGIALPWFLGDTRRGVLLALYCTVFSSFIGPSAGGRCSPR